MDKVQKHSNPECYTPSSEPFRIYYVILLSYVTQYLRNCTYSFHIRKAATDVVIHNKFVVALALDVEQNSCETMQ
jgi:hypothetical protein